MPSRSPDIEGGGVMCVLFMGAHIDGFICKGKRITNKPRELKK